MKLTTQTNFKLCVLFVLFAFVSNAQHFTLKDKDKQLHFGAGMITGSLGYAYSFNKHQNKKRATVAGICTSFAAGVIKEMFDASQGGYVEHGDILATTLGGITVSVTIPLFTKKKKYRRLDKIKGGYKYD